jgi:hypothetical protein
MDSTIHPRVRRLHDSKEATSKEMEAWKWGHCDVRPEEEIVSLGVPPGRERRHYLGFCRMRKRDERDSFGA